MEIKIRYRVRKTKTDKPFFAFLTIQDIERTKFDPFDLEIIARDLFIGLKDKNGKEIYEGDIVKQLITKSPNDIYDKYIVVFLSGCFCKSGGNLPRPTPLGWVAESCLEIIGNIYESDIEESK